MVDADRQIIHAVLAGEVDRYAELVDKYQAPAMQLAFSLIGNYDDAKDASQDAFLHAYRALGRFRGQAKFSTWLFRIVVNACYDLQRRRGRQPRPARELALPSPSANGACLFVEVEDAAADPSQQAANRELGRTISHAIGALPMKQRTAFVLHHVQGLPLDDVAVVMRCRLGTVKSHIFRATQQLRRSLTPWLNQEAD